MPQPDRRSTTAAHRLAALRRELKQRDLDGFIVPRGDEHQGEYVPPSAQRLAWLTGFTGSAGVAVVLPDQAAVFVDGRYTLQVRAQVDASLYQPLHLIEQPPHKWLADTLPAGFRLGYDPWLHTPNDVEKLRRACERAAAVLVACPDNPLDAAWTDRPRPPAAPIVAHPLDYAGRSAADKRAALAQDLAGEKLDAAVLSAPDSIAWLLNLRGGDVEFTPLPLCFGLLSADGSVELFVDPAKITPGLTDHLGPAVTLSPPDAFGPALARLGGRTVRLDPSSAPAWVQDRLAAAKARIDRGADPCMLPKACKNAVELEGTRQAHRRDGVAMVRFLAWLAGKAAGGTVTEISAAGRLEAFRAEAGLYRGPSFPTIGGSGPNGAIVHYRASSESNLPLTPGELFLLDSGGQYLDGTTDVTRTLLVPGGGPAGDEERRRFTLVLKGHIALATARFPEGTSGSQIDVLARRALWAEGLDYDHGTGHGVGCYLGVHEGPQRVSKLPNSQALLPGMILSNEPGYYKAGAYGIRTENLLAVRPWESGGEKPFLEFETLTLVPIDLALVERGLLDEDEAAWLNAYHRRVGETLAPLLARPEAAWLEKATRAI